MTNDLPRFGLFVGAAVLSLAGGALAVHEQPASARAQSAVKAPIPLKVADRELPGRRIGLVVTYFWYAMYQGQDACPTGLVHVPTSKEFLADKPESERERLLRPENRSELYHLMDRRGPKGEDLCAAPWAVADAAMNTLSGTRNDGLDLDGWNGSGPLPANVCAQTQYHDASGSKGIDNQLGRIYACINGIREKGTLVPYFTTAMRDGMWSMLIDISGVQDDQNDAEVAVDVYAGAEPMVKDANGNVLTNASLSPLPDERFHRRLKGRIRDGVLETEPVADMTVPDLMAKERLPMDIIAPRFRLTLNPDGSAEGLLGGYRTLSSLFVPSEGGGEGQQYVGYQCEGMYHALQRYADGSRNPATGKCDTISAAFRIKAVPAFIVHPERRPKPSFSEAKPAARTVNRER